MSDNVIRPDRWLQNGRSSLEAVAALREPSQQDGIGGGSGGPHDPGMEPRVAALEADMKDVRASLKSLEASSIRVEAMLTNMATRTDIAALGGRVDTLDARLKKTEETVGTALTTAIGRSISWWQFPLVLAGSAAVLTAAGVALNWLLAHGFLPH